MTADEALFCMGISLLLLGVQNFPLAIRATLVVNGYDMESESISVQDHFRCVVHNHLPYSLLFFLLIRFTICLAAL